MKKLVLCGILLGLLGLSTAGVGFTAGLDSLRVLKVSPQDHTAVVKNADGRLRLVRVGDMLADKARIVEISAKRLVLEQPDDQGSETIMIYLDGNSQRIERYSKSAAAVPRLTMSME